MKNFLLLSLLTLISSISAGQQDFPYLKRVLSAEGLKGDAFVLFAYAKGKAAALRPLTATDLRQSDKYDRRAMITVFGSVLSPFKEKNPALYNRFIDEKDPVAWINLVAESLTKEQKAPMIALVQAAENQRAANVKRESEKVLKQLSKASRQKLQAMLSNDTTDPLEFAALTKQEQAVYAQLRKLQLS